MPQLMACIVEILIYFGNGPNCQRSPHVEPFKALTQRTFACPLAGRMAFGVGRNSGASTLGSWSQWWLWRWLCKRGKYENNNMFIYMCVCVIHAFICLVYLFVVFVLYITSNIYIYAKTKVSVGYSLKKSWSAQQRTFAQEERLCISVERCKPSAACGRAGPREWRRNKQN